MAKKKTRSNSTRLSALLAGLVDDETPNEDYPPYLSDTEAMPFANRRRRPPPRRPDSPLTEQVSNHFPKYNGPNITLPPGGIGTFSRNYSDTSSAMTQRAPRVHSSGAIRTRPVRVSLDHDLTFMLLRNLKSTDLKSARLVCKKWDILASAIMAIPTSRRLDELLKIMGPTSHHQQPNEQVFMLDFNVYDVAIEKLNAFIASARGVRKLDLDFPHLRQTDATVLTSSSAIAPEVFMSLSVISKKASNRLFSNLKELVISGDLFSISPYAFTPLFFPPSTQTLTISNLGRVSIQTVFGYLSSIASGVREVIVFGDSDTAKMFNSFAASVLEEAPGVRELKCQGLIDQWGFLQALAKGCPNLEKLHVTYGSCSESSNSRWRNVKFPSLQSLTLLHVPEAQKFRSKAISHFMNNLQCLILKGNFFVGDEWIGLLCKGLPKLRSLILEGQYADITVDALRCGEWNASHPLASLRIPIDGSNFKGKHSHMELPRELESLSLNVVNLHKDRVARLAATISSACPTDTTVTFTGSPSDAVSYLGSVFEILHTGKRESEMKMTGVICSLKEELNELRAMYQQVVNERDVAVRERKPLKFS
ncbi:hypothetical protein FRC03_001519 [Tulasnella sp. 419]|nr:hypothetical protein FRC03_001519 [Tulasnella sp. 419]